ncbi:MAG TPA: hypothetical protein EYG94_00030 [Campylobacterales bacterium]|nr:hypothetical protein [Campylobacterales bacterium]
MELLTQTEVLGELNKYSKKNITKQAFYKRVVKGQIKIHYKPKSKKKFYRLDEVANVYGIKISEIESSTPQDIKEDEDLYSPKNLEQLNTLLKSADTPMIKVSVIDTFWAGKIKELKYKENSRELIPMHEALGVIQVGVSNFKTKMYEIPHQFKAQFPDATVEMMNELHMMIDKAFYEFSKTSIRE